LKAKEQEEREARLAKVRPALRNMLKGNPNVFHYTTFATADKLFAQHPIWQQARVEAERKLIFEEYVAELKDREVQEARASRARAIGNLVVLFKKLDVDVLTRWRQAHQLVLDSDDYRSDKELQNLPTLDVLLAFEDYSRVMEREFEEQMRRKQVEKTRRERKAREAFKVRILSSIMHIHAMTAVVKALLSELILDGKIRARSKWKDIYPSFSSDQRYLDLLGKPGSNPIELFWDVVDDLDQKLDAKIGIVNGALRHYQISEDNEAKDGADGEKMDVDKKDEKLEEKGFAVKPDTKESEFLEVFKANADDEAKKLTDDDLKEVFSAVSIFAYVWYLIFRLKPKH
jgi:pre-mRNA-processing factor 40